VRYLVRFAAKATPSSVALRSIAARRSLRELPARRLVFLVRPIGIGALDGSPRHRERHGNDLSQRADKAKSLLVRKSHRGLI
jgi:hypothetical protein